jgi:hypothetical protein
MRGLKPKPELPKPGELWEWKSDGSLFLIVKANKNTVDYCFVNDSYHNNYWVTFDTFRGLSRKIS